MRTKIFCQLLAALIYTGVFGQSGHVQLLTDEGENTLVLSSDQSGIIEFNCRHLSASLEVVDFFIDDQFGVVVTRTVDNNYHFYSAFRFEEKWQVDHCGASIFKAKMTKYHGYEIVVKQIIITSGERLEIKYDRINYSLAAARGSNTELGTNNDLVAIAEIQRVGLYDINSGEFISISNGVVPNSPRKPY